MEPTTGRCAACGVTTESEVGSYEDKLVRALDHHLSDRRLLAARILGKLGSRVAVPRLVEVATNDDDHYLAAEAARSLALIEPEHPVVRRIRDSGSLLARTAVREVSA